jgi:hypothetical protein
VFFSLASDILKYNTVLQKELVGSHKLSYEHAAALVLNDNNTSNIVCESTALSWFAQFLFTNKNQEVFTYVL